MTSSFFSQSFWQWTLFSNTLEQYALAVLWFVGLYVAIEIFRKLIVHNVLKSARKTNIVFLHIVADSLASLQPWFLSFVALYGALSTLELPHIVSGVLDWIITIWIGIQVVQLLQREIDRVADRVASRMENAESGAPVLHLAQIGKIILWIVAILAILANRGIEITSLVAGLGIGGIAIAFAVQNILSDLFGSFAIYFDKPFTKGDFIVVGENAGTVEKVGIKTTRIRALQGEEIVISNKELTSARIQNFKRMRRRRIAFTFGVIYESTNTRLRKIPTLVEKIISNVSNVTFDRAHFTAFGDSALQFEVVYFVESADYLSYVNAQQEINFQLKEALEKNNTPMAYPTSTVFLKK